jgi:hypothetical protein
MRDDINFERCVGLVTETICTLCEHRTGTGNCRQMCCPQDLAHELIGSLLWQERD